MFHGTLFFFFFLVNMISDNMKFNIQGYGFNSSIYKCYIKYNDMQIFFAYTRGYISIIMLSRNLGCTLFKRIISFRVSKRCAEFRSLKY